MSDSSLQTKMKIVLVALWKGEHHPEAQAIIDEFQKDTEEVARGN